MVRMRLRVSASSWMPSRSESASVIASASPSGSNRIEVAFILPPPQPGRRSRSSGRAMQSMKIGASRDQSTTCSTRSSIGGSAHCRSSRTRTSGRSSAAASKMARVASCVSAGVARIASAGSTPSWMSISTSGQYVMPSPYESARPRAIVADSSTAPRKSAQPGLAHPRRTDEREQPAGPCPRPRPRSRCAAARARRERPTSGSVQVPRDAGHRRALEGDEPMRRPPGRASP